MSLPGDVLSGHARKLGGEDGLELEEPEELALARRAPVGDDGEADEALLLVGPGALVAGRLPRLPRRPQRTA